MGTVASRGGITSVHNNGKLGTCPAVFYPSVVTRLRSIYLIKFGSNPESSFVLNGEDLSDQPWSSLEPSFFL